MANNINDLIAAAKAAFDALPPAEQERMMAEQRESWARGEMALARVMTDDTPLRERVAQRIYDEGVRTGNKHLMADTAIQEMFDWLDEFGGTKRADGGLRDLQQFGDVLIEARKKVKI